MINNIYSLFIIILISFMTLAYGEEHNTITDLTNIPPLTFERLSERLILIVDYGIHEYRFLVLETNGLGTLEVTANRHESGAYELLVNYKESLIVDDERVDINVKMNLLLYRGNIYYETDLIGLSPFLFDIPITFDYLLGGDVDPRFLGSKISYPNKPVTIRGTYNMEVILLRSNDVIEASKLDMGDLISEISLPLYEAEVRGRIPITSMFALPSYILPLDIVEMLNDVAKNISGLEDIRISYIYLDIILSNDFMDLNRDFVANEIVCINLCPTTQLDIQAVLTLSMLIILVVIIIYIKRG